MSFCNSLTFFRIWTSAKTHIMGYILSISMCMQYFITIFHSLQEIAPLSLYQNLELGKASASEKCHFAISWTRSCQYQCLRNSLSKYSTQFKRYGHFHFFQNLAPGKASTDDTLRKRPSIHSVISVNYHYTTVLYPFNLLICFKCYNTV